MNSQDDEKYFKEVAKEAGKSLCLRDKCGAVIVADGAVVAWGHNGLPKDDVSRRKCELNLIDSPKPKSDRTCCMHAEWWAIMDALRNGRNIVGGTLYFTRIDDNGEILKSGKPYCTACSRMALDAGLAGFALWHDDGIRVYDTETYNEFSYRFHGG